MLVSVYSSRFCGRQLFDSSNRPSVEYSSIQRSGDDVANDDECDTFPNSAIVSMCVESTSLWLCELFSRGLLRNIKINQLILIVIGSKKALTSEVRRRLGAGFSSM